MAAALTTTTTAAGVPSTAAAESAFAPGSFTGDRDRVCQHLQNVRGRDLGPNGRPIMIPREFISPVFNGDSIKFCDFKKKGIMFAYCGGFMDVFEGTRDIPIADGDS